MIDFSIIKKLTIDNIELRRLLINDTLVWRDGMFNWVPVSRDTDGSIYNGCGYKDGYRLSSSAALKEQANTTTSGFIKASKNDVIRMAGTKWDQTAGYNYIVFYDENFNYLDHMNRQSFQTDRGWHYGGISIIDEHNTYVYVENDITRFSIALKDNKDFAYIRISAYGSGADMIVTVNEMIDI